MKKIDEAKMYVGQNRQDIVNKLAELSITDLLIFWGTEKELVLRQEAQWKPILAWLEALLSVKFRYSTGLDIPDQEPNTDKKIRNFINNLSDVELAVYYTATMVLRSTLLAMAFVKKRIDAEEAFQASFIEELWQAENWGVVYEAEERRKAIKTELQTLENFLNGQG